MYRQFFAIFLALLGHLSPNYAFCSNYAPSFTPISPKNVSTARRIALYLFNYNCLVCMIFILSLLFSFSLDLVQN